MRRFELSEGASNKFWQVDRNDAEMTVTFGRIGTNGQTQTKSFASAAAAEAEALKLIKEKTKKGYSEVGGDGATGATPATTSTTSTTNASTKPKNAAAPAAMKISAPTPAPATTPAPTPLAKTPIKQGGATIAWTDAALREASPIRGSEVIPVRAPDAKTLYAKLSKAMIAFDPLISAGLKAPNAMTALMESGRAAFANAAVPETLGIESQAAAFALIGPQSGYSDEPRIDDFIRYWFAKEGGSFAINAFARAQSLQCEVLDKTSIAIVDRVPTSGQWWRRRGALGWRGLRTVSVNAPDSEYAALVNEAHALAQKASPEARAMLATGFEHPEWCDADLAAMPTASDIPAWFWPLVVTLPTLDAVKETITRAQPVSWHRASGLNDVRFDLIARYGSPGPLLDVAVGIADVDRLRSIGSAIALVVSEEVVAFFIKALAAKDLRVIAAAYLQSHPSLSLVPLAEAAAQKGAAADVAKAILKPIVASEKDHLGDAKALVSPAAVHLIEHIEEQTKEREEASPDELPSVLRAPPWTTKVKVPAPVIVKLTTLPFEESLQWKPGEQKEIANVDGWMRERPEELKANLARILAQAATVEAPNERWSIPNSTLFVHLTKDALLKLPPTLDLSRFSWSSYNVMDPLVARHGLEILDFILRAAPLDQVSAVSALRRVSSPRVAWLMADGFVRLKKAKADATEWLLTFPEAAAIGLIPLALGEPGKTRTTAEMALRFASSRGRRAVIEGVAKKYGAEAETGMRAVLDFDPLLTFPAKLPKLPPFWNASAFARPLLKDRKKALPPSAVDALGTMLAFTSADDIYPGIAEVKAACDPDSLGELAWDLFQAWLMAGASSKESWAFAALGILGDDESARKLTPLVRAWPGEAAHARAVIGLDVLAHIGTDVALMHLHGIAQKLNFKGLQEKAREKIDQIAEARGLTAEELADRLVPDLGLDENGSLTLDFGPRAFRVVFDETLKPAVLDESGKRLPDLPKPKQTDDEEKSKEATDTWKALKKDAKTIATGQIVRLEIAMCTQRRWPREVFSQFLLEHPLLIHVVRRLVWGVYDDAGNVTAAFRVAEDRSLADAKDDAFDLPNDASIGIVHRLDFDDASAATWGQILSDYEILQPFVQLSRETAMPTEAEKASKQLERAVGLKIPTGKVLGLDHRGWRRGPAQDGGVVCWYEKRLSEGRCACLDLQPGIFTGMVSEAPEQTLGGLTVTLGENAWYGSDKALTLGELSPIDFSELIRDLDSLRA